MSVNLHAAELEKTLAENFAINAAELLKRDIDFNADITKHRIKIFNSILSQRYKDKAPTDGINRLVHGLQHGTRTMLYIPMLINLYAMFNYPDVKQLTESDVKLLMLAMLFHDAARLDDGTDKWELESAQLFYIYLRVVLNLDKAKAKKIAEGIANKDYQGKTPLFKIHEDAGGDVSWEEIQYFGKNFAERISQEKNILCKLIHDADCLDIIRARPHFDATFLDFYRDIVATKPDDSDEINCLAQLIIEVRSLIDKQGDNFFNLRTDTKKEFECDAGYEKTLEQIKAYPLLSLLYNKGLVHLKPNELLSEAKYLIHSTSPATEDKIIQSFHKGSLLLRGISKPLGLSSKHHETNSQLEVYKVSRDEKNPTRSKKPGAIGKHGNPFRSFSLAWPGAGIFANAGFMLADVDPHKFTSISDADSDTGVGKKKGSAKNAILYYWDVEFKLSNLRRKLKLGGNSRTFNMFGVASPLYANNNEIELNFVDHYDAIYYSGDYSLCNNNGGKALGLFHAIELQKAYHEKFGVLLPIYEYSWVHNFLYKRNKLDEKASEGLWKDIIHDYLLNFSTEYVKLDFPTDETILKSLGLFEFGEHSTDIYKDYLASLSLETRAVINEEIAAFIAKYNQKIITSVQFDTLQSLYDAEILKHLITNPHQLIPQFRNQIQHCQNPLKKRLLAQLNFISTFKIKLSNEMGRYDGDEVNNIAMTITQLAKMDILDAKLYAMIDGSNKSIYVSKLLFLFKQQGLYSPKFIDHIKTKMKRYRLLYHRLASFEFKQAYEHLTLLLEKKPGLLNVRNIIAAFEVTLACDDMPELLKRNLLTDELSNFLLRKKNRKYVFAVTSTLLAFNEEIPHHYQEYATIILAHPKYAVVLQQGLLRLHKHHCESKQNLSTLISAGECAEFASQIICLLTEKNQFYDTLRPVLENIRKYIYPATDRHYNRFKMLEIFLEYNYMDPPILKTILENKINSDAFIEFINTHRCYMSPATLKLINLDRISELAYQLKIADGIHSKEQFEKFIVNFNQHKPHSYHKHHGFFKCLSHVAKFAHTKSKSLRHHDQAIILPTQMNNKPG